MVEQPTLGDRSEGLATSRVLSEERLGWLWAGIQRSPNRLAGRSASPSLTFQAMASSGLPQAS